MGKVLIAVIALLVISTGAFAQDRDAAAISREVPSYPEACFETSVPEATVELQFDVDKHGRTENIRVLGSSDPCFEATAVQAVSQWKYRPKLIDGEPKLRVGMRSAITFARDDSDSTNLTKDKVRRLVRNRIRIANKYVARGNPDRALEVLTNLEIRYRESFSDAELSLFLRARGAAKRAGNDLNGALQDYQVARHGTSMSTKEVREIDRAIVELEDLIAMGAASE